MIRAALEFSKQEATMNQASSARAVLIGALVVAAALFGAARAQALGLLVPDDVQYEPLELQSQIMEARIDNQAAQTHIRQVFFNRYGRPIEATYLLPVPKGAQVTDFAMEINGKKVRGEVLEKEKARQIYTDIVRRVRDPGLLEYVDQQIFRARVFPIPPNGQQKVEITVSHLLPLDNGVVEYQWPFDAPRVIQQRGRPATAGEFDVKLDIRSKIALKAVYSPTHKVRIEREGDNHATVRLDERPGGGEPIFRCFYTLSDKAVGMNSLTTRVEGQDGTFLLLISPAKFYDDAKLPPVDFTFILDSSGSMGDDDKIGAARKALKYCLNSLRNVDAFNIIRFSTEVEPFAPNFLDASEENVRRAKAFVDDLRASGGTNIDGALTTALNQKARKDRLHTILFITDGMPTVGITNIDQILGNVQKNNEQRLRTFVCGVGYDVNTKLLDRLAEQTRSAVQYIRPKEDLEVAISQLFDKVSRPVLTNLRIDWGDLRVHDVYPKDLPDLFAGTQLTVFGRYRDGGEKAITLYGKVGGDEKKFVYEAKFPSEPHEERAFIQTLWATRRVGYLLDQIRVNGESAEVRDEVIQLAKKYGIVTPYTSYLVQEDRPVVAGGARWDLYQRGGTGGPVGNGRVGLAPPPITYHGFAESPGSAYRMSGAAGDPARAQSATGGDALALSLASPPATVNLSGTVSARPESSPVSGQAGVEYSQRLSDLKEAARVPGPADGEGLVSKVVAGRTFAFNNGVWTEVREKAKDDESKKPAKTLKIKYLSDAYFGLLKQRPDLKSVFALGEKVELDINDYHVIIGPEGEEKLSPAQLDELAAKKK
jgi:Ca-activated chloride channel family protein